VKGSLHSRIARHIGFWRRILQVLSGCPREADFVIRPGFCSSGGLQIFMISGPRTGWNFRFQTGLFLQPRRKAKGSSRRD
jgi:hypothetical protein